MRVNLRADDGKNENSPWQVACVIADIAILAHAIDALDLFDSAVAVSRTDNAAIGARENGYDDEGDNE